MTMSPEASNKRKERDADDSLKPTTKLARPSFSRADSPTVSEAVKRASGNQLLAGYLAHEFLTNGTLFGQQWDPVRAEAVPVSAGWAELKRLKSPSPKAKAEPSSKAETQMEKCQRYVAVANLFKTDGIHLPGVVNPTQLARLLHL